MQRYRLRPLVLAVPLALAALPALASSTQLDTVTVTAANVPTSISELPRTVWVVDGEALQEQIRAGVPLKELLGQLIPSLDTGPQGRTNNGQNLRGRSVQVMIDGVSLNGSRQISRQFDSIDPFNIERIEVLSGASAVYGGGATGGIVNIITKRGETGLQFASEIGMRSGFENGEDRDWRVAQSVAGGNDRVHARLGVAYQQNGGVFDAAGKQVLTDITQTDLQYNRALDVLGNVDIKLPGEQSLKLAAQWYDSGYHGDKSLYLGPNLSAATGKTPNTSLLEVRDGFRSDQSAQTRRQMLNFDYHLPRVAGGQDFYLQGSSRREKLDFNPFPGSNKVGNSNVPFYGASRQNTDANALKGVLAAQLGTVKLSYGLELGQESFSASQTLFDVKTSYGSGGMQFNKSGETGRYPGFETSSRALFADADWRINPRWNVNAGLRQQRTEVKVDDFVASAQQTLIAGGAGKSADSIKGGSNDYAVTLINVGTVFKFAPRQRAFLNYSEGFELPDPAKYYGQGTYTLVGSHWRLDKGVSVADSPLKGIKTRQLELGWSSAQAGWNAQLAAFYATSDHAIDFNRTTLAINIADQKTRNYGLEGEAGLSLAGGWRLGGNFLAIKSQQKQGSGYQKQDITAASPSKLALHAGWSDGPLALKLQAVRNFSLSDSKGQQLDSYTVADLLGSYALTRGSVNFGVQNLFNRRYTTHWGQRAKAFYGSLIAPQVVDFQGRGRTLGVSYSLQY